jgi:hypothetical protein
VDTLETWRDLTYGRQRHHWLYLHSRITPQLSSNERSDSPLTDCILTQGKALVRAIEALGTIEPTGPFERALARLLMATYKRRLRGIADVAPAWVAEHILSASERIEDQRAPLWTRFVKSELGR